MAGLIDLHREQHADPLRHPGAIVSLSAAERHAVARALALYEVDVRTNRDLHDRAQNATHRERYRRELLAVNAAQLKIGPVVWVELPKEDFES